MNVLGVAFTGIAAGVSAGLSVLCWPQRQQNRPARRLAFLAAPEGATDPAHTRPWSGFLKRLRHNPWSAARRRTQQGQATARICPVAADLLAACLASGADPLRAAEVVAYCLRPAGRLTTLGEHAAAELADRFQEVAHLLRLGGNPITTWRVVAGEPGLRPVAEAIGRAGLSGAPPVATIRACATDLRKERHAASTAAARRAGVRGVAPLAGCFLPAFVLIGVIPIALGLAHHLL
ncbi:type II secretion system F family protein [Catenulispora pinisilvae]|uniref:type II secretion system F family protein n=1 Tax=Catenulispora pinisilvae TaxID=2705253 RepID=UPI0018914E0B|nr:type II secretion system F family protein [Catenulispora pinisilvae]